jgi:hypothetical protein
MRPKLLILFLSLVVAIFACSPPVKASPIEKGVSVEMASMPMSVHFLIELAFDAIFDSPSLYLDVHEKDKKVLYVPVAIDAKINYVHNRRQMLNYICLCEEGAGWHNRKGGSDTDIDTNTVLYYAPPLA